MTPPSPKLESFALKAHHYGRITGVSVAVHAIPDAFLLLHTGVGCKYKAAAQLSVHDWAKQPHRREGWTEVGDAALIRGAAERIGPYVRSWYDRQRPELIIVSSASHLEMTGEDIAGAVRRADATVPCPVRYVHGLGFTGDLYDGYSAVLNEVIDLIPWQDVAPEKGRVAVVGYPFDRYESDHSANQHQLRSLLKELGQELVAVLLSGQPMTRLAKAARAETLVVLPYAHGLADRLAQTGRRVIKTDLPVGLKATSAWLAQLGRGLGVEQRKVAKAAQRLTRYTDQELNLLRTRLMGSRSAVFADTPLAAGLTDLLVGLNLPPALVGLRDRSLGGERAFRQALDRAGTELPRDVMILEDPSIWSARERIQQGLRTRELQAIVASAAELQGMLEGYLMEQTDKGTMVHRFAPLILGFPSSGQHALQSQPSYGFGGALTIAQRLLDSLFAGQS